MDITLDSYEELDTILDDMSNSSTDILNRPPTLVEFVTEHLRNGNDLFVTGGAGVGKSYLVKRITEQFNSVITTSSTGTSANAIGGDTIHRVLKLKIASNISELKRQDEYEIQQKMKKGLSRSTAEQKHLGFVTSLLQKAELLIIDEISMISKELFDMIFYRLDNLTYNTRPSLLITGDYYQLPPVKSDSYAFQSRHWNFPTIELTEPKRTDNSTFYKVMRNIRLGKKHTKIDTYMERFKTCDFNSTPVRLFATNKESEALNKQELARLKTKPIKSVMEIIVTSTSLPDIMINSILSEFSVQETFVFKAGARVMFLVNNTDLPSYNGELGTILAIQKIDYEDPDTGEKKKATVLEVQKDNGQKVLVGRHKFVKSQVSISGGLVSMNTVLEAKQYPLKVAYALNVHKSQGMSIPTLEVDCKKFFENSQLYVALSRSSNPQQLKVNNYSRSFIRVDRKVSTFYDSLNIIDISSYKF
ncbi:PIF1 helicase [Thiovulum sp. ES]|nr:PIF1 helicase [Thiovulum sp. ES]